jgi:hypothetical protein
MSHSTMYVSYDLTWRLTHKYTERERGNNDGQIPRSYKRTGLCGGA